MKIERERERERERYDERMRRRGGEEKVNRVSEGEVMGERSGPKIIVTIVTTKMVMIRSGSSRPPTRLDGDGAEGEGGSYRK